MDKDKANKRREFLTLGLWAGVGALAGKTVAEAIVSQNGDTVRLITADGKVMEVDAKHLPDVKYYERKKLNNKELQEWLDDEKSTKL